VRALLRLLALCVALPARAAPEFFVEAELEPPRVYVGAEARLTLRVLRAAGVSPGTLQPPRLGDAGEIALLEVRMYETERAGASYHVFERTNVLVPLRAGRLVVPGAEYESAQYLTEQFGREALRPRVVRGPEKVLEVLPPPAGAPEPFLPARSLTLAESWSRDLDALSPGQPLIRTLVLRADGLAADRLPRLEMAAGPALRIHHDRPELVTDSRSHGMVGERVQRIVLMPLSEGTLALPAIRVRWWDIGADAERVAMLPARTLRLQPIIAPPAVPADARPAISVRMGLRLFLAAIVLLAALALWLYLRTRARRDARARLRAACRRNDARGARDALFEWAKATQPQSPPPRLRAMGAAWSPEARSALAALDAALYAGRDWDGKSFWRAVRPRLGKRRSGRAAPAAPTQTPLFKLQALR